MYIIMSNAKDQIPEHVVELVKKRYSYKRKEKIRQIVELIYVELERNEKKDIQDIATVQRCCELIENLVKKKDKIDKFEVAVEVFKRLSGLQPADVARLKSTIDFLIDSKAIKKVKLYRQVYSYARKVFISNFLFRNH